MVGSLVQDLLLILGGGLLAAWVCRRLRLSVLVGYLVVGGLLGAGVLGWVRDEQQAMRHLAEIGAFLLLFSIGLEFTLEELLRLRRAFLLGGSIQVLLVAVPTTCLLAKLGLPWRAAIMLGAAASFSSTVLVFKSLAEWGQTATPMGRRMISILLFQDAALVPLLLVLPMLGQDEVSVTLADWGVLLLKAALLVVALLSLRRGAVNWLLPRLAVLRGPELLVLFVLVVLGGVTWGCNLYGLPPALGAFGAGLLFSGNRLTHQVDALILPFRETFAAVFFVSLGLLLAPRVLWDQPWLILAGFVWVLLLKTVAALVALRATGLRWRASLGAGIGLAHLGEFSFLLAIFGLNQGLIHEADYQKWLFIGVGSLTLTPLLLKVGIRWADRAVAGEDGQPSAPPGPHLGLVIGVGPVGRQAASQLELAGWDVCLIDFSPVNLNPFAQQGFRTVAGDGSDPAVLQRAYAAEAGLAVVCVPDDETSIRTVRTIRSLNARTRIVVRCRYRVNVETLREAGADSVVSEEVEAIHALRRALEG
ncbi:MAG: cation:proton antiporter [Planctomycetota bacterium]|nr:cation:proton antiporter [Planctomycetota bacterium]